MALRDSLAEVGCAMGRAETYSLNPANGVFILDLKVEKLDDAERIARLTAFVDWDSGLLIVRTDHPLPDLSVIYFPAPAGAATMQEQTREQRMRADHRQSGRSMGSTLSTMHSKHSQHRRSLFET